MDSNVRSNHKRTFIVFHFKDQPFRTTVNRHKCECKNNQLIPCSFVIHVNLAKEIKVIA